MNFSKPRYTNSKRYPALLSSTHAMPIKKGVLYLPLALGVCWSVGTILMYAFGPFLFQTANQLYLYSYLLCSHIAIIGGYKYGLSRRLELRPRATTYGVNLAHIAILISVLKIVFDVAVGVGQFGVGHGLEDPTLARELQNDRPADYLGVFLGPFTLAAIPLGIMYWSNIRKEAKIGIIVICLSAVMGSVATAMRSGIMALIFFIGTAYACRICAWRNVRLNLKMLTMAVFIFLGFLYYGSFIAETRGVKVGFEARLENSKEQVFDFDHIVYRLTPATVRPGVLTFIYYYTHGYENLELALGLPFKGVLFGVGNSRFLTRNAARVFGDDLYSYSYFYRLNAERGMLLTRWATAYPWLASDLTFPGSLLGLFLFGALLAGTWRDVLLGMNPFATVLFVILFYQFFSLPQTSITQDGPFVFAILFYLFGWLFWGRRQ